MSWFLDYCFYENAIFGRWLPWLARKIVIRFYRNEWNNIPCEITYNDELLDKKLIQIADSFFLFKIMGGCIICSNVWQSIVTFNILFWISWCHGYIDGWLYFTILPYIFFSSFVTRKISKND